MSSNSPCAACKCLRRKCTPECVFAPYFPPDKPEKFACVHKVFGASNVSKILSELPPVHREEAVNSLAYEAETRIENPIYGCVALISILQQRLKHIQEQIRRANRELSQYIQPTTGEYPFPSYNNSIPHSGQFVMHEPHPRQSHPQQPHSQQPHSQQSHSQQAYPQQYHPQQHHPQQYHPQQYHPQQVLETQEMLRMAYEQQLHQQQYNNQMMNGRIEVSELDNLENGNYQVQENGNYHVQEQFHNMQLQAQEQFLLQQQRSGSDEGPSSGPSC